MSKPGGGPAFPIPQRDGEDWKDGHPDGMTLRDYAVIQFGAGLLAGGFGLANVGEGRAAVHGVEVIDTAAVLANLMLQERDQ